MTLCAQNDFVRWLTTFDETLSGKFAFWTLPMNEQETRDKDAELLQKIGARDRAAFAEFYDKYSGLLFSIAARVLNDLTEAEDVLQETFLQIWDKAPTFDPKLGKASSWAAILARNKAVDRIRASQRRVRLAKEAGVEFSVATGNNDTANESLYGQEKARLIHNALVELPPEQRQPIEMAYFSGLTQHEISETLHEPLGTIKARIRRGLLKLRDQMEGVL